MFDVVIIGSGVAGMTAGIYSARSNKSVLIIEDGVLGGTTATLLDINNFPSYISIDGIDLVQNMQKQCMQFGVQFEFESIKSIDFDKNCIHLSNNQTIEYNTLIIASGTSSIKLNAKNEDKFKFKGLSYCAICDGNLYKNKKIVVFTDNLSASHDIEYLLNLTNDITVCDINNGYKNDKLKVFSNVTPLELMGDSRLSKVKIKVGKDEIVLDCDGVFVDLGKTTNLSLYQDKIKTENGLIASDENMHTNIDNVFVAGDIRKKSLKQIITACADGAIAGTEAIKYLSLNKK